MNSKHLYRKVRCYLRYRGACPHTLHYHRSGALHRASHRA